MFRRAANPAAFVDSLVRSPHNPVDRLNELSWLTGGMIKSEEGSQGCSAYLRNQSWSSARLNVLGQKDARAP
jgi:hypothetical protein